MSDASTILPAQVRRGARTTGAVGGDSTETPASPTEAAQRFEEVLVRQFVKVMTKDMFSSSLTGREGGAGWMQSQRDRQRKMMTDMIAEQVAEGGDLAISKKLMREWGTSTASFRGGAMPNPGDAEAVDILPTSHENAYDAAMDSSTIINNSQTDHAV